MVLCCSDHGSPYSLKSGVASQLWPQLDQDFHPALPQEIKLLIVFFTKFRFNLTLL